MFAFYGDVINIIYVIRIYSFQLHIYSTPVYNSKSAQYQIFIKYSSRLPLHEIIASSSIKTTPEKRIVKIDKKNKNFESGT